MANDKKRRGAELSPQGRAEKPPEVSIDRTGKDPTDATVDENGQDKPRVLIRPSNHLILSIFVTFCCNPPFGVVALFLALMSTTAADEGDLSTADTRGKTSLLISIIGIAITVTMIIFVIIYITVVSARAAQDINSMNNLFNTLEENGMA